MHFIHPIREPTTDVGQRHGMATPVLTEDEAGILKDFGRLWAEYDDSWGLVSPLLL